MKVLVYPHHLEIGGSQVNAIDLAARMRDRFGHDVVLFATPGPASRLVHDAGLRLVEAPTRRAAPSITMTRALAAVAAREQADLVHAWDWPQCLDAFYGLYLRGHPVLGSIMSMTFPRFVPRTMPLTAGTEETVAIARQWGAEAIDLIEPPIDTDRDDPAVVDTEEFRRRFALNDECMLVVITSRLVNFQKLGGLRSAIDAVEALNRSGCPVRLVIVGDGPAGTELCARAERVNAAVGRRAVVLTGPLLDPRPAYAAADVVLGHGSSALRGMSFGKPTIVLGVQGFAEICDPSAAEPYFWHGFFGVGDGDGGGLVAQLECLARAPDLRADLGARSRQLVLERYSLDRVAGLLDRIYVRAVAHHSPLAARVADASRTTGVRLANRVVPERARKAIVDRWLPADRQVFARGLTAGDARSEGHDVVSA